MVKNTVGGSKTKGMARKNLTSKSNNKLRFSNDKLELYAVASKAYGNGMFEVLCSDNQRRLLHVRGKFRGRGKRDNFITSGTYILVGLREWEDHGSDSTSVKPKLQNCDLLTVYNEQEKNELISSVSAIDWNILKKEVDVVSNTHQDIQVEFCEDTEIPIDIKQDSTTSFIIQEEEINVDDI